MKVFKLVAMFLFVGIVALSCKKEVVGPTGPAGKNGNANVITSSWVTADYDSPMTTRRVFVMPTPELTQELLDNGVVMIYGRSSSNTEVWAIPAVFPYYKQTFNFYSSSPDNIIIICDALDGTTALSTIYLDEFRYVFIPSSAMSQVPAGTDINNYEDVSKIFNLD